MFGSDWFGSDAGSDDDDDDDAAAATAAVAPVEQE